MIFRCDLSSLFLDLFCALFCFLAGVWLLGPCASVGDFSFTIIVQVKLRGDRLIIKTKERQGFLKHSHIASNVVEAARESMKLRCFPAFSYLIHSQKTPLEKDWF